MAVYFPIVSSWDGRGIKKAMKEFKSLEGAGAKAGFLLKKSFMPAMKAFAGLGVAAVGAGVALFRAAQAADEDRKSMEQLHKTTVAFAGATAEQNKELDQFIDRLMFATGVADDELRPAFARLVRGTKNVGKAQRLLQLALDISGRTGKDLSTVTEALGKAADGSTTSLFKLGIGFSKAELKGKKLDDLVGTMEQRFKGGAADAANTFEGKMDGVRVRLGELWEEIGYKVLPALEKLSEFALKIADAFDEGGLAGAIRVFKEQLSMPSFQNTGIGRFVATLWDKVAAINNFIRDVPGFGGIPRMANFQTMTEQARVDAARRANSSLGQYQVVSPNRETALLSTFQRLIAGGLTPGAAARRMGITVNVNNGDPQAIINAIRNYARRNGGVLVR